MASTRLILSRASRLIQKTTLSTPQPAITTTTIKSPLRIYHQSIRSLSATSSHPEKFYTPTHEYISFPTTPNSTPNSPPSTPGSTIATIGISAHAAHALGDIVFVELPEIGTVVAAGDAMGAVESVKSASDLYTPASGTVVEVNEGLEVRPALVNESPEEKGWIVRIEMQSEEVEGVKAGLLGEGGYRAMVEGVE